LEKARVTKSVEQNHGPYLVRRERGEERGREENEQREGERGGEGRRRRRARETNPSTCYQVGGRRDGGGQRDGGTKGQRRG
jgi:hypothetical protein